MKLAESTVAESTVAEFLPVAPCKYGKSGHCLRGAHASCAHRRGGPQEGGVVRPEGYVSVGGGPNGRVPVGEGWAIVSPAHVWRCPCECHSAPPRPEQGLLW